MAMVGGLYWISPPSSSQDFKVASARSIKGTGEITYQSIALPDVVKKKTPVANSKKIIVIDPGHGGVDPGAISKGGVREKDLVLQVALKLKKAIEATNKFHVILTRSSDVYIPLQDRVRIAQHAYADLFVSLHIDSFTNARVGGAAVYTLSDKASDRQSELLAQRENKSDIIAGVNLEGYSKVINDILIDLTQRDTMNKSVVLSQNVLKHLGKNITLHKNPSKSAGFVVLKAPDVPSVLVELGYLTNSRDVKLIASANGQKKVVIALRNAILSYFYG